MPVSRKRKKPSKKKEGKKKFQPYEVVKQKMFEVSSPFPDDLTFSQRQDIILEIAEKSKLDFEKSYLELQQYLKEYDPLYLCAFTVLYFLSSPEGIDKEAIDGYLEFHHFYVEILQCLALFDDRTLSPKVLGENALKFKATLKDLNDKQAYRYFGLSAKKESPEQLAPVILQMEMMNHTLAVRNWAYEHQMRQITYELTDLIKVKFEKRFGYDPTALFDILFGLVELTNEKLNLFLRKMRPVMLETNYQKMCERYNEAFPEVSMGSKADQEKLWLQSGKNIKAIRGTMIAHSDLFLSEIISFDLAELRQQTEVAISDGKIIEVFDKLSIEFGELSQINKDYVFLNNPCHTRPFIKLDETKYFSAITYMFSHLGMDLLESLISEDEELKKFYSKEKGRYLEDKITRLFIEAFPNGKVFSGSMWFCPKTGKTYENDLILLIEDFAIILEAKSGTLTPPAKRGAPNRLFETLEELIVAPSMQAIRFEEFLSENRQEHNFKTKNGQVNKFDSNNIKYFVPLGVTLSNLGSIGCNLKKLIDAEITTAKIAELAPSISIADLEVIFELLPLQGEKIHYLARRREFEAHALFQGDELDLFGFYLDNAFNIGENEFDQKLYMNLTLKSKELDPYILGTQRGKTVKKPSLLKTKYWNDVLNYLNENGKLWLQSTYILLHVPIEDQRMFEKKFDQLKDMVLKKKTGKQHNWMSLYCGPERRKYLIIGYPYMDISKEVRNDMVSQILHREKKEGIRGILIIGCDLRVKTYPYNFIAGTTETDFFDDLN